MATAILPALLLGGCGPRDFPETTSPPSPLPDVDAIVYLIGDAGLATPELAVIAQLTLEVEQSSQETEVVVAYLGDNIYEHGMHAPDHPDYAKDVGYLESQIDIVRGGSAKGVFVPGNHDWGYKDERGLQQIRRQGSYLADSVSVDVDVAMLPPAGCPGPSTLPVGESALLVIFESDLWLRDHDWSESQSCEHRSLAESLAALRSVLSANANGENRHVIVLAHHPLKTYGSHGGYYGLRDQFFPLTNLWAPLYIPIPFLYPIARNSGITSQDMSSGRYKRMGEDFAAVFFEFPDHPLAQAAGHDHNLQVFEGGEYGTGWILVSGAGSKLKEVGKDDALFAVGKQERERGYMRIEFLSDGRVLLAVITDGTASCDGREGCVPEPRVRYWHWLAGG